MNEIKMARMMAEIAHAGQQYSDGEDYIKHLDEVAEILNKAQFKPVYVIAAYLHDILEDTPVKYSMIERYFGKIVADLVYAVTNESGKNRSERNLKTYAKLCNNRMAICIKLADRISNVRNSRLSKDKTRFFKMYQKEYPGFRTALYDTKDDLDFLWKELDNLMKD